MLSGSRFPGMRLEVVEASQDVKGLIELIQEDPELTHKVKSSCIAAPMADGSLRVIPSWVCAACTHLNLAGQRGLQQRIGHDQGRCIAEKAA